MIIIVITTPTINPTLELEELELLGWVENEVGVKDAVRVVDEGWVEERVVDMAMPVVVRYVSSILGVMMMMVLVVAISETRI